MLKLNEKEYLDKLYACWIGKNIGGTIGGPYEGKQEMLDIQGFSSPSGEPLPNDDLDLQLVWLCAMEKVRPGHFSTNTLAERWLDWLPPHWNEYGICKTNLRQGFLPPMSGEVNNKKWKTSNGAWIRSEIWAAMAPGVVDVAAKYATMDAMVDHGTSEGTCAEIFTAAIQSYAYIESDLRKIIAQALKKIPETSMVAQTVKLVIDCYDKGIDYRQTRDMVVEFNKELGWFQAPGNIGFVAIGLLYGEGDFKKSILYAVNCGDDTDCTAGTVGATLGIMHGTSIIPQDWKDHVGERIVTISISGMYHRNPPKTCAELCKRVHALVPEIMKENKVDFAFTAEPTDFPAQEQAVWNRLTSDDFLNFSPYSYLIDHYEQVAIRVELEEEPYVKPGDVRKVKLSVISRPGFSTTRRFQLKLLLPEGWTVDQYPKNLLLEYPQPITGKIPGITKVEFSITAGEKVEAVNRMYAELVAECIPYPVMVPIIFLG
ncbi:MAG: ADP-ribosylglycohydrolase family protein [Oscillospiraceae bacterium]|nr:ADP-ribosylglycohydrolase family protein [Oscillospiraceae bacterium]